MSQIWFYFGGSDQHGSYLICFSVFMDPDSCLHLIFDQIMFEHITDVNDPVCDGTRHLGQDMPSFVMIHVISNKYGPGESLSGGTSSK